LASRQAGGLSTRLPACLAACHGFHGYLLNGPQRCRSSADG
jgi:hypothetical protein